MTSTLYQPLLRRPSRRYSAYALDLDGTVYLGDALIPGADEAVAALRAAGSRVVFVTNKPLETAADYAVKLTGLGIPARREDVVTALDSLLGYLRRDQAGRRILVLAEPLVTAVLAEAGIALASGPDAADVVVVSFDRTFDYAKLTDAFRAVRRGALLIATNPDPWCPTPDGGLPDCAALLAAVEVSTGTRAHAIVGKPSVHMAMALRERLGADAVDAVVVGDRLLTDVAMGQQAGMSGGLVLSGATRLADLRIALLDGARAPDFVVASISDLLPATDDPRTTP